MFEFIDRENNVFIKRFFGEKTEVWIFSPDLLYY